MGHGIAHVFAQHGWDTVLLDVSRGALDQAREAIARDVERQVKKGAVSREQGAGTLDRIQMDTSLEAAGKADLVVEAATEKPEVKFPIFRELDRLAPETTLLASNTSAISITTLAAQTGRPAQVIGMHFMNPVPVMPLVEVIRGLRSEEHTSELQSRLHLVCRLLLEKKKKNHNTEITIKKSKVSFDRLTRLTNKQIAHYIFII